MTPVSQQFSWNNRDIASRDLLQFAEAVPKCQRCPQRMKAFYAALSFSELEQMVMDETRDLAERQYALDAITSIPGGDVYLPQFVRFAFLNDRSNLAIEDFFPLATHHPRNADWLFQKIDSFAPKTALNILRRATIHSEQGKALNPRLCQKIMEVIDHHPLLLTLGIVETLYKQDGSEATLNWLRQRWDTLIYLCLIGRPSQVFSVLESWEELREALFKNCPAIIPEYNAVKEKVERSRQEE